MQRKDNSKQNNIETTFSFDIGTASIGWAVVKQPTEQNISYDEETGEVFNNIKIVASGVRMFNEPVVSDNKKITLNVARRTNRLSRRRTRRVAQRKQEIRKLLLSLGYYKEEDFNHYLENGEINYNSVFQKIILENNKEASKYNIFFLRVKALDHQLSKNELAVVLFNLAKTRGFKSSKKRRPNEDETTQIESDDEGKAVLSAIKNMKIKQIELKEKYGKDIRTFAELIHFRNSIKDLNFYRNKEKDYSNSILRSNVEAETKLIFAKQREFYKELTAEFEVKFLDTMLFQRAIKFNLDTVGKCTYLKDEYRANKSCFSSEYYTSLGRLINLRINPGKGKERALERQEIHEILNKAQENFKNLTYKELRKNLGLSEKDSFKGLSYDEETHKSKNYADDKIEADEKKLIIDFKKTKKVDDYLKSLIKAESLSKENYNFITNKDNHKVLDQLVQLNSLYTYNENDKEDENGIKKQIENCESLKNIHQEIKDAIIYCNLSFTTYLQLSLKAMYLIIPYMEELYPKVEVSGIKTELDDTINRWESKRVIDKLIKDGIFKEFKPVSYDKLPSIAEIEKDFYIPNHAVIKRALTQVIKTFNAMVSKYGKPDLVNIELLRELKSPSKRGKHIEKREYNTIEKQQARQFCNDLKIQDSESNILKVRLWQEQVHMCPYCVTEIPISTLGDGGALQIDHIIPESKSFDNSYNNKVLVHDKCNQNKGQKTPYLWLRDGQEWEKLKSWIYSSSLSKYKKDKLLNTKTLEQITEGFVERQKNDSAYITLLIKNFINNYFTFPQSKRKNHVYATKGALTSILRDVFSLKKYRKYEDLQEDKGRFLYREIVWNKEINPELVEELKLLKKSINTAKSSKDEKSYDELNKKFNLIRENFIKYLAGYFADENIKPSKEIEKYINNSFDSHISALKVNNTFVEKFKEMEKNFIGDKHHAMDAILIGLLNASVIKQIGTFAKIADEKIEQNAKSLPKEHKDTKTLWRLHLSGSFSKKIQYLLEEQDFVSEKLKIDNLDKFKEQIWESLKNIFISRQPNRKVSGRIHEDTIYSPSKQKNEKGDLKLTKRINVSKDMKLDAIKMVDNNIPLLNAIKDWINNKDENKELFPRMPTKNGSVGSFIRKVTVFTNESGDNFYKIREGLVNSSETIRLDIFSDIIKDKKGNDITKYAFLPITYGDIYINKQIPSNDKIRGDKEFIKFIKENSIQPKFSISKKDLVFYKLNEKDKGEFAYLNRITNENIVLEDHLGVETTTKSINKFYELKKAQVDLLGNTSVVQNNHYEDFSNLIAKMHKKEK